MSALALTNVSKRFGNQVALDSVSLELRPGERLALVGENGAGKSSLMNVLYGLYAPDAGTVLRDGAPIRLRTPADAMALGIGMVHQHFTLVPTLTVAENVVLGHEPGRFGLVDLERARRDVTQTCARLGFALDPSARVGSLTVGAQQRVEIVKALHRGVSTLILDEPTAVLTPTEAHELFAVTRRLSEQGVTVVLISHKLTEVLAFATRIVVMRRGAKVAEVGPETTPEALAALMVGARTPPTLTPSQPGEVIARLTAARAGAMKDVSLEVRRSELLGIAGVDGNGQRELAEVMTGLKPLEAGRFDCSGRVGHVPGDRQRFAMVGDFSLAENVSLGRQRAPPFARRHRIDFAGRDARALELIRTHDVRPPWPRLRMGALSGGNQQKLVVGRELDAQPDVLVAVQPTRGLDLGAVDAVRAQLLDFRARGGAVVLISLDLDEVLTLADRLVVLFEGRVTGRFERAAFDERRIGECMLGATHA